MCHGRSDWTRVLPAVLLGLRTTYREDMKTTSAELVFGQQIRVPSQLLVERQSTTSQPDFVKELRDHFDKIRPTPPSRHCNHKVFVSQELHTCTHVFVRTDLIKKSLQSPYEGPFRVINRNEKSFILDIKGRLGNISIDRLKPCFTEDNTINAPPNVIKPTADVVESTEKPPDNSRTIKVRFNLETQASTSSKPTGSVNRKKSCLKTTELSTIIPKGTVTRAGRHTKVPARFVFSLISDSLARG